MDLTSGSWHAQPFWPIKHGLLATYPPLQEDLTCDVVVIGAGITGALVAYHLAEAGVSTVVLDRRDVGMGSTSATTALLQYEIDVPLGELIDKVGENHAMRSYKVCLESIGKLEKLAGAMSEPCGFQRKKSVFLASHRRDVEMLRQEHMLRNRIGIRVDWLDKKEIEHQFGFSRPAGLLSHDAAEVDAFKFAHQLLNKAINLNARVFDRTAVTEVEAHDGGVRVHTDRKCMVSARKVVYAAGYESLESIKQNIASLISTFAFVSEPVPVTALENYGLAECLIWESAHPYIYLRTVREADDQVRIIMGGEDEPFRNPALRDKLLFRKTQTLLKKFASMFPKIPLEVAYAWAGTFAETADGLAYIGEAQDHPNAYFALGYGGNGITYSVVAAEIIRDAVLGQPNPDADLFRFDRPQL